MQGGLLKWVKTKSTSSMTMAGEETDSPSLFPQTDSGPFMYLSTFSTYYPVGENVCWVSQKG